MASGKLARLPLRLSEFEIGVEHRAGINHKVADALSWFPAGGEDKIRLRSALLVLMIVPVYDAKEVEGVCKNKS